MRRTSLLLALFSVLTPAPALRAQPLSSEQQVAAAVLAAPEDLRDGATVLGYRDGRLATLREGAGDLICLADDPADDRFHVACYYRELDPFMARGRELSAQHKSREEVEALREAEIRAGTLRMPTQPTTLYSLTGPAGSYDPASGTVSGASPLYVVYIPYATAQSTGLSPAPSGPGVPWIMSAGTPWAHIMIIPQEQ